MALQPCETGFMHSGRTAADEAPETVAADVEETLILSLFRLHRAAEPKTADVQRLIEEVRQAAEADGDRVPASSERLSQRRTALCTAAVRRFLARPG